MGERWRQEMSVEQNTDAPNTLTTEIKKEAIDFDPPTDYHPSQRPLRKRFPSLKLREGTAVGAESKKRKNEKVPKLQSNL